MPLLAVGVSGYRTATISSTGGASVGPSFPHAEHAAQRMMPRLNRTDRICRCDAFVMLPRGARSGVNPGKSRSKLRCRRSPDVPALFLRCLILSVSAIRLDIRDDSPDPRRLVAVHPT